MGAIKDAADDVFRDFENPMLPVAGTEWKPLKEDIREDLFGLIDEKVTDVEAAVAAVTSITAQGDAYQAWWQVKSRIALGQDVKILFLGDSTSTDSYELAYKIASMVFVDHVAYSVEYRTFDFVSGVWSGAVEVQTGTGDGLIEVYNASINGGTLDQFTGNKQAAIGTGYHLVIINHGHNYNSLTSGGTYGLTSEDAYYRLDESIEDIARVLTDVPIIVSLQNPSKSALSTQADERCHRAWERIAAKRGGVSLVDVRRVYLEAGKPDSWYGDDIHPTETGHIAGATEHRRCFNTSKGRFPNPPQIRPICLNSTFFDAHNLLVNGRFTGTFSTGTPQSWTKAGGSGTNTEESVDVSFMSAKAVKLEDDVRLQQAVTDAVLDRIKGREVVLAALLKVNGGDEFSDAGFLRLNGGIGGMSALGVVGSAGSKRSWPRHGYPYANGRYAWKFLEESIPYSATSGSVVVLLYGSEAESNGKYALWGSVGLFLKEDFERMRAWF